MGQRMRPNSLRLESKLTSRNLNNYVRAIRSFLSGLSSFLASAGSTGTRS